MNLFFLLLLATLIAGGYYAYQRLKAIEREIRDEQQAHSAAEEVPVSPPPNPLRTPSETAAVGGGVTDLSGKILRFVEEHPGLAQTELYAEFDDGERRDLQKLLRELDQQKRLRREKKGSSYRLYPL